MNERLPVDWREENAMEKIPRQALLHEQDRTRALHLAGDLAVQPGRHAGDPAREDLPALGDEALQEIGILVVDRLDVKVHPTPGHRAVCFAEVGTALRSFRLHEKII